MKALADKISKWGGLDDVKSTFQEMGFEVDERNNNLFVKLDKDKDHFLKIVEQKRFSYKKQFNLNVQYVLLIKKYEEFKFVKISYTISDRPRYLQFDFKSDMSRENKNQINRCIRPDDILAFDRLFGDDELDIIVKNLQTILKGSVSELSENALKRLGDSVNLNIGSEDKSKQKSSAKRALLIVASAAMFHARLDEHLPSMKPKTDVVTGKPFKSDWPPGTLQKCYLADDPVSALLESWRLILAIDYRPIFQASCTVLESVKGKNFTKVIKDVVGWSKESVTYVSGLKHDVLGRLFHIMLDDARYDGSFYTSVPSAALLAGITIRSKKDLPKDIGKMRIVDPACGTGTLLMAITEKIMDVVGEDYDSKIMIEKVLSGIDINMTALHMAATTLGLISPTTRFQKMDIRQADFGMSAGLTAAAGSLELYSPSGVLSNYGILNQDVIKKNKHIDTGESQEESQYHNFADIVIMNPPFTRSDLRHKQLDKKTLTAVKKREQRLFRSAPIKVDKSSSGQMFILLAERLVKEGGTIAMVLPLVASTNTSTADVRVFLAQKFHIEIIIASHDPKRFWFSENTDIAEMLIVLRKSPRKGPTKIVNLAINPSTVVEATQLAKDVTEGNDKDDMQTITASRELIEKGDWTGVLFFSPYLVELFSNIKAGEIFETELLGDIANISTDGRSVRGAFVQSDKPGNEKRMSIYGHETDRITSIETEPYTYIIPKKDKKKKAETVWSNRSTLLLPERLRTNLTHVSVINSTTPTVGSSWNQVIPNTETTDNIADWSKAMAVYLNSTLGIVSLLGTRVPKIPEYPRFSVDGHRSIPIPKLSEQNVMDLVKLYKDCAKNTLGLWSDADDETRKKLDSTVCTVLKLDPKTVDKARLELSKEPMCTGQRYKPEP